MTYRLLVSEWRLSCPMILFGIVFFVVALVLIGAGIAIGFVGSVLVATLVGLGIVSSSVLVGLNSGKVTAGLRAFLIQCGVAAGIPAGAVCAWVGQSFIETFGHDWKVWAYGAVGGAFAGVVVAISIDLILRKVHTWSAARWTTLKTPAPRL